VVLLYGERDVNEEPMYERESTDVFNNRYSSYTPVSNASKLISYGTCVACDFTKNEYLGLPKYAPEMPHSAQQAILARRQ